MRRIWGTIKNKFAPEHVKTIKEISLDVVELESVLGKLIIGYSRLGVSKVKYRPIYIASYVAKKQINRLKC